MSHLNEGQMRHISDMYADVEEMEYLAKHGVWPEGHHRHGKSWPNGHIFSFEKIVPENVQSWIEYLKAFIYEVEVHPAQKLADAKAEYDRKDAEHNDGKKYYYFISRDKIDKYQRELDKLNKRIENEKKNKEKADAARERGLQKKKIADEARKALEGSNLTPKEIHIAAKQAVIESK